MNSVERQSNVQLCLYKIQNWADENDFTFSKLKLLASMFVPIVNPIMILVYIKMGIKSNSSKM